MSYVNPQWVVSPSWLNAPAYTQATSNITAYWGDEPRYLAPQSIVASKGKVSSPSLTWQQFVLPLPINQSSVASVAFALKPKQYRPHQFNRNASWVDAGIYNGAEARVNGSWFEADYITALGFDTLEFGTASLIQQQFVQPTSIYQGGAGKPFSLLNYQYPQPVWTLDVTWFGKLPYTQPSFNLSGLWTLPSESNELPVTGWDSSVLSADALIRNVFEELQPNGITSGIGLGAPNVRNKSRELTPKTWQSSAAGKPLIYNLTQYQPLRGIKSDLYGKPFMLGGVWYLNVRGYDASEIGRAVLINTTANQEAKPKGIDSLSLGAATVSPRIIYAKGFYNNGVYTDGRYETIKFGMPDVRTPVLFPTGINDEIHGLQTIWFHTRPLAPNGIESYQSGYGYVYDPTQFIQTPSLITSAIFGDTAIKNLSVFVRVPAINDGSFSDYSSVTNSDRLYAPKGIDSLSIGNSVVFNKTPQIFTDSIVAGMFGLSAIGYRIRSISVTGFDLSAMGRADITKSPELTPKSINPPDFGANIVWHKVRTIRLLGFDSAKLPQPTAWFRYRYISPKTKDQSSTFASPILTHNLREVIASGKPNDSYGRAWVSRGTRTLSVSSVDEVKTTNHLVGRHQTIEPAGYVATLFGERIIPEARGLYPLGFREQWGLATASLWIRHLNANGFLTIGSADSDRFGQTDFYNLTQYIQQDFDIGSGLVPPDWSEWTLIENRNKRLNATGHASQRFGYSQIDNNATALLPASIEPPAPVYSEKSMIAHAIRPIPLMGIEPPPVSSWSAVYNAADVLLPTGFVQLETGNPTIVNTRRYYNDIGRFESLEFGVPMIAYRIRTLDIESRYSIEPPQIELPVVDLYTRYVEPRGYEATGHGLPALSIHFNIIETRWAHRDRHGIHKLHNVTPEVMPWGTNVEEHGVGSVRTEWREVKAQGDTITLFGAISIADTTRKIEASNWRSESQSYNHKVIRLGAAPYATQQIRLDELQGNGDGGIRPAPVGVPSINQNVLYQKSWVSSFFGQQAVWSNNITPIGVGIGTDFVSNDMSIINRHRVLSVVGIEATEIELGKPRMSHHTIWATRDITEQTRRNNGGNWNNVVTTTYGRPNVESTIRTVKAHGFQKDRIFGMPAMTQRLQVIAPDSFRYRNFGIPTIPFVPQDIVLRNGFYDEVFGRAVIAHEVIEKPLEIKPKGFPSFITGDNAVDNYIRHLGVNGFLAEKMGTKLQGRGDNPFMWQGLRVGEHVHSSIGAGDTSSFGNTWISLKIRQVETVGFNASSSGYSLPSFEDRMTVKNADKQLPKNRTLHAIGISPASTIGYQDIKLGQHYIKPDGNSDQFRKGAF